MNRNRVLNRFAAGLAVVLFGTAGVASAQLLNPSFEFPSAASGDVLGTTDWGTFNQAYTTTTVARGGTQSLKTFGPFMPTGGTGATQALPATPGQTWVGEIWALNYSADPIDNVDFGVFKIEFLDSAMLLAAGGLAGVDIFESNAISAATPLDQWTLLGVGTAPAPAGTAYARAVLVKVDMDGTQGGSIFWDDARLFEQGATDVAPGAGFAFELHQNVPNPFNPMTRIEFILGQRDAVDLSVFDVTGRRIVTLVHGEFDAGPHEAIWNGKRADGGTVAAGIYRCVLRTSTGLMTRSMVLVK